MCGIAGIWNPNSIIDAYSFLYNSIRIQNHRGPDDCGIAALSSDQSVSFFSELNPNIVKHEQRFLNFEKEFTPNFNLYFAHNRLSIIDVSPAGHQPMASKDQSVWITYNGEIYNYKELRNELQSAGYEFHTQTDTEVIINAYKHWGTECQNKFYGMWAFVLYDRKKNILFGSRDRTGVKPLYYYRKENILLFASELKTLIKPNYFHKSIHKETAFNYLVLGRMDDRAATMVQDVMELEAGHQFILNLSTENFSTSRWYKPNFTENSTYSNKESIEYIHSLLHESVKKHLRSDVPVGICLSGGIDSSAIACLSKNYIPEHLKTYTASFKSKIDETHWAEKVALQLKSDWIKSYPNADDLIKNISDLVYTMDSPFYSFSVYSQYHLMKDIAAHGTHVTLDGQGGDELFAGYIHHLLLHQRDAMQSPTGFLNSVFNNPTLSFQALQFQYKNIVLSNSRLYTKIHPEYRFLNADFLHAFPAQAQLYYADMNQDLQSYLNYQYYQSGLKMLLKSGDRASMRFSIESRMPFADDHILAEYLFSIPSKYKIQGGISKYLLREAVKKELPQEIYNRQDKVGFATPEYDWYKASSAYFKEVLNSSSDEFIDYKNLFSNYEKMDTACQKSTSRMWRMINFTLWRKIFSI